MTHSFLVCAPQLLIYNPGGGRRTHEREEKWRIEGLVVLNEISRRGKCIKVLELHFQSSQTPLRADLKAVTAEQARPLPLQPSGETHHIVV